VVKTLSLVAAVDLGRLLARLGALVPVRPRFPTLGGLLGLKPSPL
jgi:hypothetical protein